jgi:diguanylate cyclase (GGDEF)-like protein/PAS domain S-box-containing protein
MGPTHSQIPRWHRGDGHWRQSAGAIFLVALAYFAASQFALMLAPLYVAVAPFWPASGIALALLLLGGRRLWPGVALGAFASALAAPAPAAAAFAIAAGFALEALLGASLTQRYARGAACLDTPRDILMMVAGAAAIAPLASATAGTLALTLTRVVPAADAPTVWLSGWAGSFTGVLLLGPPLLAWGRPRPAVASTNPWEAAGLIGLTALTAGLNFWGWLPDWASHYPLIFLLPGCLVWAVARFHHRGVTAVTLTIGVAAVSGTAAGHGPLAGLGLREILMLLQLFAFSVAVPALLAAAMRTQQEIAQRAAAQGQRLAVEVLEHSPDGVMVTGPDGRIIAVNSAFTDLSGYGAAEAVGQRPSILKSGHHPPEFYEAMWQELEDTGRWRGEIWNRRKDGAIHPEWLSITRMSVGGAGPHYIATFSDIGHQDRVRERLHHLAYYDALTGLPNRLLFNDRLQQVIALAQREQRQAALLFLDLDRFKEINDTLGHGTGDGVLKAIARRVGACLRDSDTFSRLGGDEFTVIIPKVRDGRDAALVAEKIIQRFATPFQVGEHELFLSTSIGIALYPHHGATPEDLVKHADTAMYLAKENGRNLFQFYQPAMTEPIRRQLEMDIELRRALSRDEITVCFQPLVSLAQGRIVGVEALARWTHPRFGVVPPDVFIPIAEHAGMIGQLGVHVLGTALRQVNDWRERGLADLRLSVNLSVLQLRRPGLVEAIEMLYAETGFPLAQLELEITEGSLLEKGELSAAVLLQLSQLGCTIAIDDFGTGYSSLSYLRRLPIHRLKVDRSFVDHVHDDPHDAAIAGSIIAMAHHLQLKVTAEGVETAAQLEFLRRHHCDEAQGYLFSAPRPAADIEELLRTDDSVVAALATGARHPPRRPRRLSRPGGPHSSR